MKFDSSIPQDWWKAADKLAASHDLMTGRYLTEGRGALELRNCMGDVAHVIHRETTPSRQPLHKVARHWCRKHGYRLVIDWTTLAS